MVISGYHWLSLAISRNHLDAAEIGEPPEIMGNVGDHGRPWEIMGDHLDAAELGQPIARLVLVLGILGERDADGVAEAVGEERAWVKGEDERNCEAPRAGTQSGRGRQRRSREDTWPRARGKDREQRPIGGVRLHGGSQG